MGFNQTGKYISSRLTDLFEDFGRFLRLCLFCILSVGAIPNHIAFIMDGNRRYAKKKKLNKGAGHRAGYLALICILKYCYELGVKYVTIYAFSIDNFKRRPDEVKDLMDLMLEKIEELLKAESIVNQYGIRIYFIGNLKLLSEPVRIGVEKIMTATANNTKCTLLVCIAYTSRDEIVHAVQDSCKNIQEEIQQLNFFKASNGGIKEVEDSKKNVVIPHGFQDSQKDEAGESQATKAGETCSGPNRDGERGDDRTIMVVHKDYWDEHQASVASGTINRVIPFEEGDKVQGECSIIKLVDIEKYMYMAVAPEPDILVRSSGETRLSNFLLWQASDCPFYSPDALWPEMGLWHLVWAVLNFQYNYFYLEKKRKQS